MHGEKYLIAGTVFLQWPQVAGAAALGAELLLAQETLDSLETFAELGLVPDGTLSLVRDAVSHARITLLPRANPKDMNIWEFTEAGWPVDDTLIRIAREHQAILVSDEAPHQRMAERASLRIISGGELLQRITAPPPSEKVGAALQKFGAAVRREALLSALASGVAVWIAIALFNATPYIMEFFRPWAAAILVFVAGLVLYLMRAPAPGLRLGGGVSRYRGRMERAEFSAKPPSFADSTPDTCCGLHCCARP
jgi:hypothetical protein